MKKAFTLIELLVVIGIIALLAAVLIPSISGGTESARAAKCLANMNSLAKGCQSFGMSTNYYPVAGSFKVRNYDRANSKVRTRHGWIGWGASTAYASPYTKIGTDEKDARLCLRNGQIWNAVSCNSDVYVCPSHRNRAKENGLSVVWSYVMNADFLWQSKDMEYDINRRGKWYGHLSRADRRLLFAELPFIEIDGLQSPQFSTGAEKHNDPTLQFKDCDGEGDEIIAFNHKSGKMRVAHVCFADGHTERLKLPKNYNSGNIQDLTKWLCLGGYDTDDKKWGDVVFGNDGYELLK